MRRKIPLVYLQVSSWRKQSWTQNLKSSIVNSYLGRTSQSFPSDRYWTTIGPTRRSLMSTK